MLQWGFPQFYNQSFGQVPSFYFSGGYTNPFVSSFGSIFPTPQGISFPRFNFQPSFTPFSIYNQAPSYNFLNNQLQMTTLPKPQGIRSTLSNWYDSAVDTTKEIVKKGKEYAKRGYRKIKNFGHKMVETAKKYLGYNKKDGSYKKFTQGRDEKWCADFVSYVARECGKDGFNFPAVQGIWDWGKENGKFHTTAKVGDAVIFKGVDKKGKCVSHTGIVTSVENGIVKTIEGNTSGKVAERSYSINDSRITGYVTIA